MPITECQNKSYVMKLMLDFFKYSQTINPEDVKQLSYDDQKTLLDATIHHPLIKKYPINKEYAILFLKRILNILEQRQEPDDIHDDLYICLCEVMNNEGIEKNIFAYRHYVIDNDIKNVITIKETNNMVVNGTTGMRTWEAAIIFADWAISNKELFENKCLLELGSGIGFTGITIVKQCQVRSLCLTDCHDRVLETLCENIEINFPKSKKRIKDNVTIFDCNRTSIDVMKLDWNDFTGLGNNVVPDIVIGVDIVYDPSILPSLCSVFDKLFVVNMNLKIYVASVIRKNETHDLFLNTLDADNYSFDILDYEAPVHFDWNKDISKCLLQISKK